MAPKKTDVSQTIDIQPLKQAVARFRIIGTERLVMNKMSSKAMQGLLVGSKKKTAREKQEIKHHPRAEFRAAAHTMRSGPTLFGIPTVAIKAAMCTAALETEGINKTAARRLLYLPGEYVSCYGTPTLRMDVVRSADMNRTPDIRTRPSFPKWGAEVEIRFAVPQLSIRSVASLLNNAGFLIGLLENRMEKGKAAWGAFRILGDEQQDDEWDDLVLNHGRDAQQAAFDNPSYDEDSEAADLMEFYAAEEKRRAA